MKCQVPNVNALSLSIQVQRRLFLDLIDGEVTRIPVIPHELSELHKQRIQENEDKMLTILNVYGGIVCQQQWETLIHGKYLALLHSSHQKVTNSYSTQDETTASVSKLVIE